MIKAGSNSRLGTYELCPHKARLKFVDKIEEPMGPAVERGSNIHKEIEDFITGKIETLTCELHENAIKFIKESAATFKANPDKYHLEQQWGFDANLNSTDWKTAWYRAILDMIYMSEPDFAYVTDWKTGGVYFAKHRDQMIQQAIAAFAMFSELATIDVRFVYVDKGITSVPLVLTRDKCEPHKQRLINRNITMTYDDKLLPNPGYHCRQCYFGKQGICEYRHETARDGDYA